MGTELYAQKRDGEEREARALKDCKKAGVGPLAAMYVRLGYFIQRASCKASREPMYSAGP